MQVEVHRPDEPDTVLATATWQAGGVVIEAEDPTVRERVERVFRHTPVVVDDAAYRRSGTRGEVVLQPGEGTNIEPGKPPTPASRWSAERADRVKQATYLP